jgi:hypothetical protein
MPIRAITVAVAAALAGAVLWADGSAGGGGPALGAPVKNVVLVHGAWVDASGWKPVYEILTRDGYNVTMVQEPLTSPPRTSRPTCRGSRPNSNRDRRS